MQRFGRRFVSAVSLALACISAPAVRAAEGTPKGISPSYEHLQGLEWVQGGWRREWTADKDIAQAKKGDKLAKEWRFSWTPNKNALRIHQAVTTNGKAAGQVDALFGWNGRQEQITGAGFSSDGNAGGGWTIQPDDKTFTLTAGASDWVFTQKGRDRLIVTDAGGTSREFQRVEKKK